MSSIQHAGHTLIWEEHSPGQHTLIFLNGDSASRLSRSSYLPHFAPLGRCVTRDLPGHFPAQCANLRILGNTGHAPQIEMADDC